MDSSIYGKTVSYRNCTVVAGSNLARRTSYGPVPDLDLRCMQLPDESTDRQKVIKIFSCGETFMSEIRTDDWLWCIRLSRDCYEQNLEIYRSRENEVRIRTTREVRKGEELKVWYEDVYGRESNVPHLTLWNIKGIHTYQCTACETVFAYPNSLKLHIMKGCDPLARSNKVYSNNVHTSEHSRVVSKCNKFERNPPGTESIRLKFSNMRTCQRNDTKEGRVYPSIVEVTRNSPITSINCQLSYASANNLLSPYKLEASVAILPTAPEEDPVLAKPIRDDHVTSTFRYSPGTVRNNGGLYSESEEEPIDILHKSFIEFSTKGGHRCVYCGKFYSRKYGLKIHLRTHTGYKPLKCKICLRAFGDPSNLNKHIRLHSEGNTPYKCTHCGKILARRRDLLRHLSSRHPDRFSHLKNIDVIT